MGVNETIGERTFDFPMKSQVKLPDLKQLFDELDANQKQIDKLKENYAGTRVEEETEYDKTGKVTKKELNEYTFFYLDGDEVSTLVKKDGKASQRRRTKERKREDPEADRRAPETRKKEGRKRRESQGGREAGQGKGRPRH